MDVDIIILCEISQTRTNIYTHIYIHIYVYIYCLYVESKKKKNTHKNKHTQTKNLKREKFTDVENKRIVKQGERGRG